MRDIGPSRLLLAACILCLAACGEKPALGLRAGESTGTAWVENRSDDPLSYFQQVMDHPNDVVRLSYLRELDGRQIQPFILVMEDSEGRHYLRCGTKDAPPPTPVGLRPLILEPGQSIRIDLPEASMYTVCRPQIRRPLVWRLLLTNVPVSRSTDLSRLDARDVTAQSSAIPASDVPFDR